METDFENVDRNENESPSVLPYNKEIKEKQKKKLNFDSLNPAFIMTLLGASKIILLNIFVYVFDYGYNCDYIVLGFVSFLAYVLYSLALFGGASFFMIVVPIIVLIKYCINRKEQGETIKALSIIRDIVLTLIASLLFTLSLKFQYELFLNCF